MAKTTLRVDPDKNGLMQSLVVLSVALLVMERSLLVDAVEYRVGGSHGWSIPSNPLTYKKWAQMNRFQVVDTLLFVYESKNDSVMQVSQDDYENCNTKTPIATFSDGNTSFKFQTSGPYYFISGIQENCVKNEKLVVIVMSDRSKQTSSPPAATPPAATPPAAAAPPAAAPPTAAAPSPAPSGSIDIVPAPVGGMSPSVSSNGTVASSGPTGQKSSSSSNSASAVNTASSFVFVGACLGSLILLDL